MIIFEERWYIKQWFPNLLLWPKCGVKIDASGVAGWFRNKTKQKNMVKCKIIMQKKLHQNVWNRNHHTDSRM